MTGAHRRRSRHLVALTGAAVLIASAVAVVTGAEFASAGESACNALTVPVHDLVNPTSQATLLTLSDDEALNAKQKFGFTQDDGTPFLASRSPVPGTVAVHRLYRPSSHDFVWIPDGGELSAAVSRYGYTDQGVNFYAATAAGSGCVAVHRLLHGATHRFGLPDAVPQMVSAGWKDEGARFYAGDSDGSEPVDGSNPSTFSLAVVPDTQTWVVNSDDDRLPGLTSYLVQHRSETNLQQVLQTGDLVNWGWLAPSQYTVAAHAFSSLQNASIPYLLTVGNHDTRAVGVGGSAYVLQNGGADCLLKLGADLCHTNLLVRHTEEFNQTFDAADEHAVAGQFEAGKVDNSFTTFTAGGKKWLTVTLEFCPRAEAVDWARSVVASHPDYNVIVETHYYLDGDGGIGQTNDGYGATSPQYVYDHLISQYPNIKMVFSGHTGEVAYREDTGIHGNRIASMAFNDLGENTSNAFRTVTVNADTGAVTSHIYAPNLNRDYPQYDRSTTLSFVG